MRQGLLGDGEPARPPDGAHRRVRVPLRAVRPRLSLRRRLQAAPEKRRSSDWMNARRHPLGRLGANSETTRSPTPARSARCRLRDYTCSPAPARSARCRLRDYVLVPGRFATVTVARRECFVRLVNEYGVASGRVPPSKPCVSAYHLYINASPTISDTCELSCLTSCA